MDLAEVVSGNLGVDLTWAPYEDNPWITNWLITFVGIGIGFIPVVGPALSIGLSITITAVTNPDNFISNTVLSLDEGVFNPLLSSTREAQEYIPQEFIGEGDAAKDPTTALRTATGTESSGAGSRVAKALREKYEREGAMKQSPWFANRVPQQPAELPPPRPKGFAYTAPENTGTPV